MAIKGILGGTFNPIHNGHLTMARIARAELRLDSILLIPTGVPPHKAPPSNGEHRLNMTRLAAAELDCCEVSDIEVRREGSSFTYITLSELHARFPQDEFIFIMGADMMCSFSHWRRPDMIVELARLAVVPRPGASGASDKALLDAIDAARRDFGAHITLLRESGPDISSTQIRAKVARGEDISTLVPHAVAHYILENGLYSASEPQ